MNSYHFQDWDFARLLVAVAEVPGIERVRFMSPHPKDFPPALLDAVAGHPKICKHIHLPVQSGNDRVLEVMGRCYSRKEYITLVEAIRRRGNIALSTDIICGFSGETDDEYLDTYRLVHEIEYHSAFIFKYSERKNTIAARTFTDDIPEVVKSERVRSLVDLQKTISLRKNRELIGQTVDVLTEGVAKKSQDQWMGHTESNTTVVWEKARRPLRPGEMISIRVEDASPSTLFGKPAVLFPQES